MLNIHLIKSTSNPIFKDLKVFVKNGVNKNYSELFCVAGFKNNLVALENSWKPNTIFISSTIDQKLFNKIKSLTKKWKIRWIQLSSNLVLKLNELGNGNDFFVYYEKINFFKQSFELSNQFNYALCDHVQQPENLGSIIRNAAAFNIKGLFLWNCASIFLPKTIRTSAGNIFNVSISIIQDLNKFLNSLITKNIKLIGLENSNNAKDILNLSSEQLIGNIFIFGNEGNGIHTDLSKKINFNCKITINNKVDSLNVATTSAIVFYELNKKC